MAAAESFLNLFQGLRAYLFWFIKRQSTLCRKLHIFTRYQQRRQYNNTSISSSIVIFVIALFGTVLWNIKIM